MAKTGLVAVTIAFEAICRTLSHYHVHADAAIDAAVTAGTITSAEGATAHAFLDTAQAVCAIFKAITGY